MIISEFHKIILNYYIALGALVFFIISFFSAFLFGFSKGKKAERRAWEEAEARKANDAVFYEKEKADIMREVFGGAEQKKAELSGGGGARERFDRINDSLRGKSKN
jgi:hypothetical protein